MDLVNHFCTIGRGSRDFTVAELHKKFSNDNKLQITDEMEGKLFFQLSDSSLHKLHTLKSVERVFFLLKYEPTLTLKYKTDIHALKSVLEQITGWGKYYIHLEKLLKKTENGNENEPVVKRYKHSEDESTITFRVSCKCSQTSSRHFYSKQLAKTIGNIIKKQTTWNVNLRKPDIEVIVHINHRGTVIGIPAFLKPLAERNYLKHTGLRTTIAWILGSLANIQTGDVVIDPMCGNCILPIEAALEWKGAEYLASDVCQKSVENSQENLNFANVINYVHLFKADVTDLPLKSLSVDKIICDLPFGNKHGEYEEMQKFYPRIIQSLDRILKNNGMAVLLTSTRLKDMLIRTCTGSLPTDTRENGSGLTRRNQEADGNELLNTNTAVESDKEQINTKCSSLNEITDKEMVNEIKDNASSVVNSCDASQEPECKRLCMPQCSDGVDVNVHWTLQSHHYLKMGEMHSVACVFNKNNDVQKL